MLKYLFRKSDFHEIIAEKITAAIKLISTLEGIDRK